jgi:predicted deacylase
MMKDFSSPTQLNVQHISYEGDFAASGVWHHARESRLSVKREKGDGDTLFMPKIVAAPERPGFGMKIGIFGGLHGDEQAGTLACYELVRWASKQPKALRDYELHIFPICNPTGHQAGTRHCWEGLDLNSLFWRGSEKEEVKFLEAELRREAYDGIIALHSDDTSEGCYGFVSGALLSEHLLEPALAAAHPILARNESDVIDGFKANRGIIKAGYTGILSAPPEQHPKPLEIVFETPALAPMEAQVKASVIAVQTILEEFRQLQAYAANL